MRKIINSTKMIKFTSSFFSQLVSPTLPCALVATKAATETMVQNFIIIVVEKAISSSVQLSVIILFFFSWLKRITENKKKRKYQHITQSSHIHIPMVKAVSPDTHTIITCLTHETHHGRMQQKQIMNPSFTGL